MWDQKLFGARLRAILNIRGMKQKQLAKALKVSPATISHWQNNPANFPSLDKIAAAAEVLGVSPCWLAFACEAHYPPDLAEMFSEMKGKYGRIRIRRH